MESWRPTQEACSVGENGPAVLGCGSLPAQEGRKRSRGGYQGWTVEAARASLPTSGQRFTSTCDSRSNNACPL